MYWVSPNYKIACFIWREPELHWCFFTFHCSAHWSFEGIPCIILLERLYEDIWVVHRVTRSDNEWINSYRFSIHLLIMFAITYFPYNERLPFRFWDSYTSIVWFEKKKLNQSVHPLSLIFTCCHLLVFVIVVTDFL